MNILSCRQASAAQAALGIKVSNSEPAPLGAFRAPPRAVGSDKGSPLRLRPSELAERLRPYQATAQGRRCGSWIGGKARLTSFGNGDVGIGGHLASCSSPRCPRCRVPLMGKRQAEIQASIDWWLSTSPLHRVSMLTLTAPHTADHSLPRLLGSTKGRKGLAGAVALLKERAVWKRQVKEYVSGQEVTHGRNGFHPHYHILVFHAGDLDQDSWYRSWAKACTDAGLGRPSRAHGLTLQPAESAAAYMAKWGIAAEVTGAHVKDAKNGSQAVWDLEQKAAIGNRGSRHILTKYYQAMKRRRTHTFSRGLSAVRLRHALGLKPPQAHFLFDTASSFRLHEDRDFKAVLLQALADYQLPVPQVFSDLSLVAEVVDYSVGPPPQMPYDVRRRAERQVESAFKRGTFDKQTMSLLLSKAKQLFYKNTTGIVDDISFLLELDKLEVCLS